MLKIEITAANLLPSFLLFNIFEAEESAANQMLPPSLLIRR